MEATEREARRKRWDARRREIIAERKKAKDEAEAAGLDYWHPPLEMLPMEPPGWFEPRYKDGEVRETVTVPVGDPQELRIPADELSLIGSPEGDVRPVRPGAAVEALAGDRPAPRPAPPQSALEKIDATIASLARLLPGRRG